MAINLQNQLKDKCKVNSTFKNTYCVIDQINQNKKEKVVHLVIESYPTQADRDAKVQPFYQESIDIYGDDYDYFETEHNPFAQAYSYLQSKAMITGATGDMVPNKWYYALDILEEGQEKTI